MASWAKKKKSNYKHLVTEKWYVDLDDRGCKSYRWISTQNSRNDKLVEVIGVKNIWIRKFWRNKENIIIS